MSHSTVDQAQGAANAYTAVSDHVDTLIQPDQLATPVPKAFTDLKPWLLAQAQVQLGIVGRGPNA